MNATNFDDEEYLLGTSDEELDRLRHQHHVWLADTLETWRRAGFRHGDRLLDLGCGPGFSSLALANLVGPLGRVLAVDRSNRFLSYLRQRAAQDHIEHIETQSTDVEELELEPCSLDGVYVRWLMCFLPDPERVLRRLSPALRPGARVAIFDYFNYESMTLAPRSDSMATVLGALKQSFKANGGNMEVQEHMGRHLHAVGLKLVATRAVCHVVRPQDALWHWPKRFFMSYLPRLVDEKRIDESCAEQFWRDFSNRERDPGAFMQLPPMFELIAEKPLQTPARRMRGNPGV